MKTVLDRLVRGDDLSETEAAELLVALTDDALPPALVGAVLTALRIKGETPAEVRGFAASMRGMARRPALDASGAVDVVGTGGDGSGSLNLSTGTALLTAAAGQPVVKHGNRSVSSRSGSADVLEVLGCPVPLDESGAGACLDATGFTFLFAPYFHPAMKSVGGARRALGVRTVFNILGPLTNPAAPAFHLIGAFDIDVAKLMAEALSGMAIDRAFVVHGALGWDEATPIGPYTVFDIRPGAVTKTQRDPRDVGFNPCRPEDLAGGDPTHNADAIRSSFRGEPGAHRDALILGAGLALEVTGRATDLAGGMALAADAIDDGRATSLLGRLATFAASRQTSGV